jgi:hypothetical protein
VRSELIRQIEDETSRREPRKRRKPAIARPDPVGDSAAPDVATQGVVILAAVVTGDEHG